MKPLKQRLLIYIRKVAVPIASGELQRIVAEKTTFSPQNVGRRMRELENEGLVIVEYRKGHAWYRATPPQQASVWNVEGKFIRKDIVY